MEFLRVATEIIFDLGLLIIIGLILYFILKTIVMLPLKALGLTGGKPKDAKTPLYIDRNRLYIDGKPHDFIKFPGTLVPETEALFHERLQSWFAQRPPLAESSGRFNRLTFNVPPEEAAKIVKSYSWIMMLKALIAALIFLLAVLKVTQHIPRDAISFKLPAGAWLMIEAYTMYRRSCSTFFFARWQVNGSSLIIKGLTSERRQLLHEIQGLEFTLMPYSFEFKINLPDGSSMSVSSKNIQTLLPLYDCIVRHRPELAFQPPVESVDD